MKRFFYIAMLSGIALLSSCSKSSARQESEAESRAAEIGCLKDSLENIAAKYSGEVGIALLTGEGDTLAVNNEVKYPLMSVFKFHQAIALCDLFERQGLSLDSVVTISSSSLNPETWSPMLKDHTGRQIVLPVRELLRYTLMQSDNNASNYMFETIRSVAETDSCVATLIPRESFRLAVTEAEMWSDHSRCYENCSSPLGAAMLIDRFFNDSTVCPLNRDFICTTLGECRTGTDRIVAPLAGKDGVTVAHKTGSGFRDENGMLSAHNDVAFVTLPDGRHYSLAVLVKDFHGSETEAAKAIAEISAAVYAALVK
ncbi:MAG: class A beta-lactamase [Duncaniella sp.]|uniref:class A beta-lactamase n=1 Tax=Duncaniella sp. TaxID=2518496 RepID=UPI0023CE85FA|nr:class A beta-lactamase [Duncaniella sp.]MDE5989666.1 class A beta-lactamase [Duncaniella sp.]